MSVAHRTGIALVVVVALGVAALASACGESTRTAPVAPVETVVVPPSTAPAQPPLPLPPPDEPKPTPGPTTILVPIEDGPSPSPSPRWSPAPPASSAGCAPFDRTAVAIALASVNVQACARPGGVRGAGHVKVTYAPSGQVVAVTVDGGPFPGTPEATCIATRFRAARIPAFCVGAPVSIGKSFTVS